MSPLLALMLLAAPAPEPDAQLQELTRAYQQACETRIFGQFDDVCGSLHDQIAHYRADLRRRKPSQPAPPPTPPPAPPAAVGVLAPVTHEPVRATPPR